MALGSELVPRKSVKFGTLKDGAGKGDLWSGRLPKENRVVRRELSFTITKSESVRGRAHNTWEWSEPVTNPGLAD